MFQIKSQPGAGGVLPFELLNCFKCETPVQDVLSFIARNLTVSQKYQHGGEEVNE